MKQINLLLLAFILFPILNGCSYLKPVYFRKQEINSRYPNGNLRTQFYYKRNKLNGTVTLFDSTGNVELKFESDDSIEYDTLNYMKIDSNEIKKLDVSKIGKETDKYSTQLGKKYGEYFSHGVTGTGIFWIWYNSNGDAVHVICKVSKYINFRLIER